MSDYAKTTNFTAKDNLSTGNVLKVIKGSYFDTEFDAIAVASATKYDSNDIATQGEAEGLANTTALLTPERLNDVLVDNGGIAGQFQALAAPGNDVLWAYDFGTTTSKGFTLGAALEFSGDTVNMKDAVAGAGLAISSSIMSVGGGDGITANANDVALTAASVSTSNPISVASGVINFDANSLTAILASGLAATDTVVINDAGVNKGIEIQELGMRVQLAQATQTLAAADMNSIMEFTATATLTLPLNATVALPIGVPIVLNVKHATQVLTVTAAASVTLVSTYHPGGASAESDVVSAGGTALLYKTAADVWCLSGNTVDA